MKLDMEKIRTALKSPIVLDLRNIYEPDVMEELGFTYVAVGRRRLNFV